jgi:hypothetical protein
VIPAGAFNGFVAAANHVRGRRHDTAADAADEFRPAGTVVGARRAAVATSAVRMIGE